MPASVYVRSIFAALFFFILLTPAGLRAQTFGCKDSFRINRGAACHFDYMPVCGCDGQTYRNACHAENYGGVLSYTPGICDQLALELNPNPVVNIMRLNLGLKEEGSVSLCVMDLFGTIHLTRNFSKIFNEYVELDISSLPVNVYFVIAQSGSAWAIKRFVKVTSN